MRQGQGNSPTRAGASPTKGTATPGGKSDRGDRDTAGSPKKTPGTGKDGKKEEAQPEAIKSSVPHNVFESEGHAYMKAEEWEKAVESFTRVNKTKENKKEKSQNQIGSSFKKLCAQLHIYVELFFSI